MAAFLRSLRGGASLLRERERLEARLLKIDASLSRLDIRASDQHCFCAAGDDLSETLGAHVGLDVKTVRLLVIVAIAALVWTRGRSVARSASVLVIVALVHVWVAVRRLNRWFFPPPPPATWASKKSSPKKARAKLPPADVKQVDALLREVCHKADEADLLGAADLLSAIEAGISAAPAHSWSASEARRSVESMASPLSLVKQRGQEADEALRMLGEGSAGDGGWQGGATMLGSVRHRPAESPLPPHTRAIPRHLYGRIPTAPHTRAVPRRRSCATRLDAPRSSDQNHSYRHAYAYACACIRACMHTSMHAPRSRRRRATVSMPTAR